MKRILFLKSALILSTILGGCASLPETKDQAEGLNALLLMAKLFPQEKKYDEAFRKQWEYIKRYLIDRAHGGWYKEGLDKSPEQIKGAKGSEWKVNYHESRALMNCIKMLRLQ